MADAVEPQSPTVAPNPQPHWRRPAPILVAVLIVVVIFALGLAVGHASMGFAPQREGLLSPGKARGAEMGLRGGRFGERGLNGGTQAVNQNRLEGVVTSVNGSTITIAGDGATNTVTTNSSTQYTGGSQAAVNDTVAVVGSINNGTFTAMRIVINP